MIRPIFKLLALALLQLGVSAPAHAQISATRYIDDQGVEVIVNRDAPLRNSILAQPKESPPAPARASSGDAAARTLHDPRLRISATEQDRRDRDRVGILRDELDAEARKYATAMQRMQDGGGKNLKLSAADTQRLTEELYDHQKNIQALNAELRRTRGVQ